MEIIKNFTGGNIRIVKEKDGIYFLDNELRDGSEEWFCWVFAVFEKRGRRRVFLFLI